MLSVALCKGLSLSICLFLSWMVLTVDATAEFRPVRSQISRTSFSASLVLSPAVTTQSASVSCQASVVDSVAAAENLVNTPDCAFTTTVTAATTTPTQPTTIPTTDVTGLNGTNSSSTSLPTPAIDTPPDPNSPWNVLDSRFDIPENSAGSSQSYKVVITQRATAPIAQVTEIVVTTCCVLNSSSNTNYRGNATVAMAVATVEPSFCANCNNTLANPTAERTVQNPGFVEIAPCSCDLTLGECDFGCSCDGDCTANNKARFGRTIPGLQGGQGAEPAAYQCDTSSFDPPDWHVLTCVYWENNAYLGLYYLNRARLTSLQAITSASGTYSRFKFSLAEFERRNVNRDFARQQYEQGLIIQTHLVSNPDYSGTLSLPQSISGSACNPLAPVRFLMPFESSCATQLTATSCIAGSTFIAGLYAMSNATATNFRIMSNFAAGSSIASEVRYYCLTDYSAYQPVTTNPLGGLDPSNVSSFPSTLLNEDCYNSCDSPACLQYNAGISSPQSTALPPECTAPSLSPPVLDTATDTCNNVVLDVRYTFEWSGPEITRLIGSVILANIAGANAPQSLTQRFSVQWQHRLNVSIAPLSDNYQNTSNAYPRSGNVGYEMGKALHSGCSNVNATFGAFSVNPTDDRQMAVWRPGVDGLCVNAQRQFVTFGDDIMSTCALRLNFNRLNNSCAELRTLISNHLNVLMAGDVIGRHGYNNPADATHWITVLRQNLSAIEIPSLSSISVNMSVDNSTVFRLADQISGICFVPSAINLNVLYAQTGAAFGHPRYEIVGAYINYTHSNWSMECMGANSQRCQAGSVLVQNFFLHSSVRFIQIPPVPETQDSRFYTRFDLDTCESDTCERFRAYFATDECYFDTCWQEIAYPLTSEYKGDSQQYALAFFLMLVLGIVGYVAVSKPGWS